MYCPNCGRKIPDDAVFCPECGAKIEPVEEKTENDSPGDRSRYPFENEKNHYQEQETQILSSEENEFDKDTDHSEDYVENDFSGEDQTSGSNEKYSGRGDYGADSYPEREYDPIVNEGDSIYEKEQQSKGAAAAVIIIAAAAVAAVFLILNRSNLPIPLPGQSTSSEVATQISGKESVTTGQATVTPTPASGNEKKSSSRLTVTPTPTAKPKPTVTPAPTIVTPTPTTDPLDGIKDGDFIFPDSDTVPLTESNLTGLSAWELTIARNEIVARHGWIFNRKDLQDYFNQKSWYHPVAQFNLDTVLSKTELNNMTLIQKYQDEHGLQTHG